MALQARRVLQEKPCRRGDIRDAQDNLLAVSEDVWDIGVDPDVLTNLHADAVEFLHNITRTPKETP